MQQGENMLQVSSKMLRFVVRKVLLIGAFGLVHVRVQHELVFLVMDAKLFFIVDSMPRL